MMNKKHFHTLIDRYLKGECSEQEKKLVEQWFSMQGEEIPKRSARENEKIKERVWIAVQDKTVSEKPAVYLWPKIAVAAAAIVMMLWGGFTYFSSKSTIQPALTLGMQPANMITIHNTTDSSNNFRLADGSQVYLSSESSLSYPNQFETGKREVYLKGSAFFKVVRDTERPFYVHSGEVTTKVLGTSFWVTGNNRNEEIEVAVVSGKVSVAQMDKTPADKKSNVKGGVILTANQRVKYTTVNNAFETGLVDNPAPLKDKQPATDDDVFIFNDVPVTAVIERLAKTYGIEIILENEMLSHCLFQGNISNQSLYMQLDLLCSSINATYEIRGTRILISGRGCSTLNSDTYEVT